MNEDELRTLVDRARDAEGMPSEPPPGLLQDAHTAARRRRHLVSVAVGVAVAVLVLAGVALPRLLGADDAPSVIEPADGVTDDEGDAPPDELRVTCTDAGPQVETTTVAAAPAGVVLVVTSTMTAPGSYLTYASDGVTGGDPLPGRSMSMTYAFPPGTVTLGCASPPGMDETGTVDVEVVDPNGHWQSATLADFGCRDGGGQPSWIAVAGEGPTPREAVDDLLADFVDAGVHEPGDYTADPAPTGYTGADRQTWVAAVRGTPEFSIVVTRSGAGYAAHPETLCGPA